MFEVGDVVHFHSPTVGKAKYHICLGPDENGGPRFAFLFVNSEGGFRGDCVLDDGDVPGLPISRTQQTVVSFSNISRIGEKQLALFEATKVGEISGNVAGVLLSFVKDTKILTSKEKKCFIDALGSLI